MLSVFLAIMAIYVLLLVFVLQGRWSNLKFAGLFRKAFMFWSSTPTEIKAGELPGNFSILYGQFQATPVLSKTKIGLVMKRSSPSQRYSDNGYFTSLHVERKDSPIRTQDEATSFMKERGDFRARIHRLRSQTYPGLNIELIDDIQKAKRDFKSAGLEPGLSILASGTMCPKGSCSCLGPNYSGFAPESLLRKRTDNSSTAGNSSKKKLRLSRGIWAKNRRRNIGNVTLKRNLSTIPERDESEERHSFNLSSTNFNCEASDSRLETCSSAQC